MGRSKRFLSLLAGLVILSAAGYAFAVLISANRFTPVYTLTDDRAASVINENFRRALNIIIEDKGFAEVAANATTSKVITLNVAQTGTDYGIFLMPSWDASARITTKTVNSFTVTYADPGAGAGTFDWILVR